MNNLRASMRSLPSPAGVSSAVAPHMVPSLVLAVARIPLLHNGKTARTELRGVADAALEARIAAGADASVASSGPDDDLARWVLSVWASIGVHAASLEDDFFGSGGHSLLAMRLVAELNSAPPAPGMGDGKRVMLEVRASNGMPWARACNTRAGVLWRAR